MAGALAALPTSRLPSENAAIHDARRREAARGVSHAAAVLYAGGQKTRHAHLVNFAIYIASFTRYS